MRISKYSLTLLLIFSLIAVASCSSQFQKIAQQRLSQAHIDQATLGRSVEQLKAQYQSKNCSEGANPQPSCNSCLQNLTSFIAYNADGSLLNKEELRSLIESKQFELTNRYISEAVAGQDEQCQNVKRRIEILLLEKSHLKRVAQEQANTINSLEAHLDNTQNSLRQCNRSLEICRGFTCPDCPPQKICPTCPPPTPAPDCPLVTCQACEREKQLFKQKLSASEQQVKNATEVIGDYKQVFSQWNTLVSLSIPKVRRDASEKIASKGVTNVNISKIVNVLKHLEEKANASSDASFKHLSHQYQSLVSELAGEFVDFIDNLATASSIAAINKQNTLKNFSDAVKNLKECNEKIKARNNQTGKK